MRMNLCEVYDKVWVTIILCVSADSWGHNRFVNFRFIKKTFQEKNPTTFLVQP